MSRRAYVSILVFWQVLLIGLKVSGAIDWSWWIILIPALLVAIGWASIGAVILIEVFLHKRRRRA